MDHLICVQEKQARTAASSGRIDSSTKAENCLEFEQE